MGARRSGRGRFGLVFWSSGAGFCVQPREVRTEAAMGLVGKYASWLSFPMFWVPSRQACALLLGAWQAVEEVKATLSEARKSGPVVSVVESVERCLEGWSWFLGGV